MHRSTVTAIAIAAVALLNVSHPTYPPETEAVGAKMV
jgi:hypothetical protein